METNELHCGDNLEIMRNMPDECVDLIYLDPPFFSNRQYEVIWGDDNETRSFDDRWEGGIEHYIGWMRERLVEMHRILAKDGSIYLHCDHHASHYLKIKMDEIFGRKNFKNDITWSYNTRTMASQWYARKHDNILFYTKSDKHLFNADDIRIPHREESIKQYNKIDENGKRYKPQSNNLRTYLDERGQNCGDVWEIQILGSRDKERLGYPTQKPLKLLERIIRASSNEGDIVFDPFCGCGTTVAAAKKLGRQYIGIDINPDAIALTRQRLAQIITYGSINEDTT